MSVGMCTRVKVLEEARDVRSLKLQLTGSREPWTCLLGTELGSLEEQYLLLSHLSSLNM